MTEKNTKDKPPLRLRLRHIFVKPTLTYDDYDGDPGASREAAFTRDEAARMGRQHNPHMPPAPFL